MKVFIRLAVAAIFFILVPAIAASLAACGVASTAGVSDAGGEDTGTSIDAGMEDAASPGDAGGEDATPPDGAAGDDSGTVGDGGGQDAGQQSYTLSGTVTVEGKKPRNKVIVAIFDQPPTDTVKPVGRVICDADGRYLLDALCDKQGNCTPIGAGSYWLAAVYDLNNDGQFNTNTGDLYTYYAGSPVTVPADATTGLDMDVALAQGVVRSVYTDSTLIAPQPMAMLLMLEARVLSPVDETPISDAVVEVTDPAGGIVTTLTKREDPSGQGWFYIWSSSDTGQPAAAADGEYSFTFTHAVLGASPLIKKIPHHPFTKAVAITAPAINTQYAAPQDVTVTWADPATAMPSMLIVHEAAQDGSMVYSKPSHTDTALPHSPETIPAATFAAKNAYTIQVFSGRTMTVPGGYSMEETLGVTTVSFK